jgi:hypothetical protein
MGGLEKGAGFAITTSVTTILGVMAGLYNFEVPGIILGSILLIALADSLSDAFGIHVFEETGKSKHILTAPVSAFLFKFLVSLSFFFIVLFVDPFLPVCIFWGMILITLFTYYTTQSFKAVFEHLALLCLVVVLSYFLGEMIKGFFG